MKVNCDFCKNEFNKRPNEIKKTKGNYCSMSCAAKANNAKRPKRKLEGKCLSCNNEIPARMKKCKKCRLQNETVFGKYSHLKDLCPCGNIKYKKSKQCQKCYEAILLQATKLDFLFDGKDNAASRYTRIREHARKIAQDNNMYSKGCTKCGYSKHVEICHIKSIKDFDDSALITEINDPSNLIPLCPNCHWEFDNPDYL